MPAAVAVLRRVAEHLAGGVAGEDAAVWPVRRIDINRPVDARLSRLAPGILAARPMRQRRVVGDPRAMTLIVTAEPIKTARARAEPPGPPPQEHHRALGYLRAFVTVLVVAHHAVLAYNAFAPEPTASLAAEPRWWKAFPVVDPERSHLWALLNGFNDGFFMALMFFLSGFFVWGSLRRKGTGRFVRDRALRLGLPFVLAAAIVAPLAYYPAYAVRSHGPGVAEFARQWLGLGEWPAGPVWFIWLLLAFDVAAAALFRLAPALDDRLPGWLLGRPLRLFMALVGLSAAAYVPLALVIGPLEWTALGPFQFQTSRLLLYAVYFAAGIAVGAYGVRVALTPLARRWPLWVGAAVLAFILQVGLVLVASAPGAALAWAVAAGLAFALSCAASGFAALALFLRFADAPRRAWDSLRDNAYGIFLLHYAFASWFQYALLAAPLPAIAKGALVFAGTLALSWVSAALLRRIRAVARVI